MDDGFSQNKSLIMLREFKIRLKPSNQGPTIVKTQITQFCPNNATLSINPCNFKLDSTPQKWWILTKKIQHHDKGFNMLVKPKNQDQTTC